MGGCAGNDKKPLTSDIRMYVSIPCLWKAALSLKGVCGADKDYNVKICFTLKCEVN